MVYWLARQTFNWMILFGTPRAYLPHPLCTSTHTAVRIFIVVFGQFQYEPAIEKKRPTNKEINKNKIKSFSLGF